MNTETLNLADIEARAEKFIKAHDEMIRINQGIGGLAIERPDLMPDHDAWSHASDVEHADTLLAVILALRPRTITSMEELDALPFKSVIVDAYGRVFHKWLLAGWQGAGPTLVSGIKLPATLLPTPETSA